jgi:hypothetical protein
MFMHIVYSACANSPAEARDDGKIGENSDEIAWNRGTCRGSVAADGTSATHIPQSENICRQYDNDAERGPKLGLSRAAQRIGFALWVIAYGALARHPSPSVTGSH